MVPLGVIPVGSIYSIVLNSRQESIFPHPIGDGLDERSCLGGQCW